MAVPKKKSSKVRTRRRYATYVSRRRKLIAGRTHLVDCKNCGASKLSHHVCLKCGYYAGNKVLEVNTASKKIKKIEA